MRYSLTMFSFGDVRELNLIALSIVLSLTDNVLASLCLKP